MRSPCGTHAGNCQHGHTRVRSLEEEVPLMFEGMHRCTNQSSYTYLFWGRTSGGPTGYLPAAVTNSTPWYVFTSGVSGVSLLPLGVEGGPVGNSSRAVFRSSAHRAAMNTYNTKNCRIGRIWRTTVPGQWPNPPPKNPHRKSETIDTFSVLAPGLHCPTMCVL
jgi:hypothetical protein